MSKLRRYARPLLAFVFGVLIISVAALWLQDTQQDHLSPLPTPAQAGGSPLATPRVEGFAAAPSSWKNGGPALLWVALGSLLAIALALVILRWHRRAV